MKRINMSNSRWGSLVALEYMGIGNNGAIWKCRCDCGEIKNIEGYLLRRGSVKTCGCGIGLKNDFTGKKFGKLNILKRVGSAKDRSILWDYKCDCGNLGEIKSKSLLSGVKSCGCLRRIKRGQAAINRIYRGYREQAKVRNLSFDIPINKFIKLTSEKCHYCESYPMKVSK